MNSSKVFAILKHGGPDVITMKKLKDKKPNGGRVAIRQKAIGINFMDTLYRRGLYNIEKLPAILGFEGVGVIEEVGEDAKDFKIGDRVGYGMGPIGAYTERRIIDKQLIVSIPKDIDDIVAAACLTKGLTAHYLLFRTYKAAMAKNILVHSAAGGVGQFLCQWAKHLGVNVIGTVGRKEKVEIAKENGCSHVVVRGEDNMVDLVRDVTKGEGVQAVYDGICKDVFEDSIKCLTPLGMYINYGISSGGIKNLNIETLSHNSIFFTRPSLALYKSNRLELVLSAAEVFNSVSKGILRPYITTYAFEGIPKAHEALDSGANIGSFVAKV